MRRVTLILALLVVPCILLTCANAQTVPVRILLGAREVPLAPTPVYDGTHVLAPLSIFSALGAGYVSSSDESKVSVTTADGRTGDIETAKVDDHIMVPMDKVADFIGAEKIWNGEKNVLTLLAHLKSVNFEDDVLTVHCSFPVTSSAHYWDGKIIIDMAGTKLATEAKEVYIGSPIVTKARLGETSDTTARVVLDLAKNTGYKLETQGAATEIMLRVGGNLPATAKAQPAPQKQPSLQPYKINKIQISEVSDSAFNVIIRTSSKGTIGAALGVLPPEISVNLPGGQLSSSFGDVEGTHRLLKSTEIEKVSGNTPGIRLKISLERPMTYGIDVQDDAITMHVRLPDHSGGNIADKLIVVDAGHGGREKGAQAGGSLEKDINLGIARSVAEALRDEGAKVILTRDGDEVVGLSARSEVAINHRADFFISIHCNSNGASESATGIETYYHMQEASPRLLALAVHSGVCLNTGMCDRRARSDRSLYSSGLAVLRRLEDTGIPGILVECGYVNNSTDRAKLLSSSYRAKLAAGIVAGFKAYVEGTPIQ